MPFCKNCGAPLTGTFCTTCGARTSDAPAQPGSAAPASAAMPTTPVQAAPAARKTSPIVWILGAVVALFVLIGIAIVGAGFFVVHKAREAGLDPELMRNNPGLATAKLLAATNPDLEVVSVDDGKGRITIRQKSSGKTMTVTFDEMKHGRFSFHEDGKDAVTVEAQGEGQSGTLQMKSGSESLTIGANQANMPSWIPSYPNSKPQGNFSMNGKDGSVSSFQFQTHDALKDVFAFYENGLKQNGFAITTTTSSDAGGLLSARDDANKRTAMVTVGTDAKGTTVSVTFAQK